MRNRNVLILLCAVAATGLVLAAALLLPRQAARPGAGAPALTQSAAHAQTVSVQATAAQPTAVPARAYLLVSVNGTTYQPLPLSTEGDYTVTQANGAENVIHVTSEGVSMKSSTCDNQDCVKQGEVTLANKDERILSNMIICLPNQVVLELYTPEELLELLYPQQEP